VADTRRVDGKVFQIVGPETVVVELSVSYSIILEVQKQLINNAVYKLMFVSMLISDGQITNQIT